MLIRYCLFFVPLRVVRLRQGICQANQTCLLFNFFSFKIRCGTENTKYSERKETVKEKNSGRNDSVNNNVPRPPTGNPLPDDENGKGLEFHERHQTGRSAPEEGEDRKLTLIKGLTVHVLK